MVSSNQPSSRWVLYALAAVITILSGSNPSIGQTAYDQHGDTTTPENDTLAIRALITDARVNLFSKPEEYSDSILAVAMSRSVNANYNWGIARTYQLTGFLERAVRFDLAKAAVNFEKAIESYKKTWDREQVGITYLVLGTVYSQQGKLLTALDYEVKGSEILDYQAPAFPASGWGLNSIACIYVKRDNYALAMEYHLASLKIFEKNPNRSHTSYIDVRTDFANTLIRIDPDSAIRFTKRTLEYMDANQIDDKAFVMVSYKALGDAFLAKKDYLTARSWFEKALDMSILDNSLGRPEIIYCNYANALIELGELDRAENYLYDFIEYIKKSKALFYYWAESDVTAYKHLSHLYEKRGDLRRALEAAKKYQYYSDSVSNLRHALVSADMDASLELVKRDKENQVLIDQLAYEVTVRKIGLIAIVAAIILVSFIVFLIIRSKRRITEKNRMLNLQFSEIQLRNKEVALQANMLDETSRFLKSQNVLLEELNAEKDGLMSVVAHDLRAPFNRAKGLAGLLNNSDRSPESREVISRIVRVCDDGLGLIKNILEVNSAEKSMPPARSERLIAIRSFVEIEILTADLIHAAGKKNIALVNTVDHHHMLHIDTSDLQRVLENLITNAIKFSPPGTSVFINARPSNLGVSISVQDQGPGFTSEDKRKMFKKFQRLSAQPTGGESSTGLGLAIVKSLVERLKGQITVESTPGVGTEFILDFPHVDTAEHRLFLVRGGSTSAIA